MNALLKLTRNPRDSIIGTYRSNLLALYGVDLIIQNVDNERIYGFHSNSPDLKRSATLEEFHRLLKSGRIWKIS